MPDHPPCKIQLSHQHVTATRQLEVVRALLGCIDPFPARKGLRKNVMRAGQDRVMGFTLGKTRRLDIKDALVDCRYNRVYPELLLACQRLVAIVAPTFRYNCIQVNKNVRTAKHTDAYNKGPSVFVAFGSHRGGGVNIHATDGVTHLPDGEFYLFDGRVPHETDTFSGGDRYSLVFFVTSLKPTPPIQQRKQPVKVCPK